MLRTLPDILTADGDRVTTSGLDADWWRSAVVYQVYVRSFADADGDGTGDLAGVRDRLPYLRALGVDAIWFSPWYPSPQADSGYDVIDYRAIDPRYGTLAEAEALIPRRARPASAPSSTSSRTTSRSARVVPRGAGRLAGFERAGPVLVPARHGRQRRGAAQRMAVDLRRSGLDADEGRRRHPRRVVPAPVRARQPDLNWTHPDVWREHEDVLRFWFDRGVSGIRIDSAALLVKDPELVEQRESYAAGEHPFTDRDDLHEIYRGWRRIADSYLPARLLVGELWLPDAERFAKYLRRDELHTAFNFDFLGCPWDAAALRVSISTTLEAHTPVDAPATWVLANHDVTRTVTRYGRADTSFSFDAKREGVPTDIGLGYRRARAAALLAMALPGSMYIYQGEELGLPEVEDIPVERRQDPMYFRSGGARRAATAAGSRSRGPGRNRRSDSARRVRGPGWTNPVTGPTARSPPRQRTRPRCSRSTAPRCGSGVNTWLRCGVRPGCPAIPTCWPSAAARA